MFILLIFILLFMEEHTSMLKILNVNFVNYPTSLPSIIGKLGKLYFHNFLENFNKETPDTAFYSSKKLLIHSI